MSDRTEKNRVFLIVVRNEGPWDGSLTPIASLIFRTFEVVAMLEQPGINNIFFGETFCVFRFSVHSFRCFPRRAPNFLSRDQILMGVLTFWVSLRTFAAAVDPAFAGGGSSSSGCHRRCSQDKGGEAAKRTEVIDAP